DQLAGCRFSATPAFRFETQPRFKTRPSGWCIGKPPRLELHEYSAEKYISILRLQGHKLRFCSWLVKILSPSPGATSGQRAEFCAEAQQFDQFHGSDGPAAASKSPKTQICTRWARFRSVIFCGSAKMNR